MGTAQLGAKLTDDEAASIAEFLRSLTGEQPKVDYPILPLETAQTPKPQF